ncbi:hypothetical protein O181_047391 [Austropuccinia psidii MF-1]|uniref:Uncharacterized protein n=1 Tax=Austropuccinia psidii MF-1 TaxID=1389203 RepID=A0A9Q3DNR0_9BASI|nr:hypothetical protein [Austropuccinia psidii MF-1]
MLLHSRYLRTIDDADGGAFRNKGVMIQSFAFSIGGRPEDGRLASDSRVGKRHRDLLPGKKLRFQDVGASVSEI